MSSSNASATDSPRRDFCASGLAELLRLVAVAAAAAGGRRTPRRGGQGRGVSLIYVFLKGGLSTIDTFDMKPDAPAEFRGEFNPRRPTCPACRSASCCRKLAEQIDKFVAAPRLLATRTATTARPTTTCSPATSRTAGFNPILNPNNQRPSLGSIIASKLGPQARRRQAAVVPPYVCLPQMHNSAGAGVSGRDLRPARRSRPIPTRPTSPCPT